LSEQTNIAPRKIEIVNELMEDLSSYNTIGIIAMESIGAKTVQKLRADLRDRAKIKVAKNTLMRKALELVKGLDGADKLMQHVSGPVAFLFTNDSPYQIANYLEKNKVAAPAKGGQTAPKAVIVPKQNTGVPPGTFISELNSVGLPTRIEQGTIAIPEDTQVLEVGDKVSTTLASILARLGIEPFEVGLSIELVLESGDIIMGDELLIDFDAYLNDLMYAYQKAVNLSVNAGILTSTTAPVILATAQSKAMSLAASIGYVSTKTAPVVLGRARALALALMRAALQVDPDAVPGDLASQAATTISSSSTTASTAADEPEEEIEEEIEGEVIDDDEDLGSLF
jgi:large subunit ribosomal protein L10